PSIGSAMSALAGAAGPILTVIAAVAALVAIFVKLWKTNEEFRDTMTGIWAEIKEKVVGFIDGIKERFEALGIDFDALAST
ncbi:MAG: hypothetical protein LUB63_04415, partial [Oscillospiraceae bacterium]|nr:hypothetical protein [Oscillospiraceae bacterium]